MPARDVKLTNLDKVFWPEDGLRKGDLVDYYRAVAPGLLPHLRDRPLTVKRYPNGIDGETFFQKNAPRGTPEWVRTIRLPAESARRDVDYILCNDVSTLLWLGNLASIELHPWLSRADKLDRPDAVILDVDPPEGKFDLAVRTALATREVLERRGIQGCVKTSGAKGIHVYVPITRRYGFDEIRTAAHALAVEAEHTEPALVSTEFKKTGRDGKVFLDFTRTGRGQHVVAALSPRARPGAPVSFPLGWEDLEHVHPLDFTIRTVPKLVDGGDPWTERCPRPQSLPRDLL